MATGTERKGEKAALHIFLNDQELASIAWLMQKLNLGTRAAVTRHLLKHAKEYVNSRDDMHRLRELEAARLNLEDEKAEILKPRASTVEIEKRSKAY
ncbi:hypothetical protein [Shewanella algae]|uniref:hypothetical protein n=1 Tax=Shewanella algae TaxID=38313 RepID=UPI0031F5081F